MIKTAVIGPLRDKDIARVRAFSDRYDFDFYPTAAGLDLTPYEVILGQPSRETVMALPGLRWLQIFSAGTDGYTLAPGFRRDILLTNVTGAFGPGIAEHVLALLLCLYKGYDKYLPDMATGAWRDHGAQESPVGKRVLILGAGDVGRCTARLLRAVGAGPITGLRRTSCAVPPEFDAVIGPEDLDAALRSADVVVGALPGTAATANLLDARRIALLRPRAVLINVGRGSLVDADALCRALCGGKLAGAALDVTDPEPLPPDHALWRAPNTIILPHITGGSFDHLPATTDLILDIVTDNLRRYAAGEPLQCVVDVDAGYKRPEQD